MEYKIKRQVDAQALRRDRLLDTLGILQKALLLAMVASLALSVYAFRTDISDAYVAYRTRVQLSQVEENSRIYFEPDSTNSFSLYGSSLAVLNQGTFRLYSPTGTQQLSLTHISSVPAMSVSDNYVMLYSRGNPEITVSTLTAQQCVLTLSGGIINVTQNDAGCMTVVHDDSRYRGVVSVFDNTQHLIYEWKTSEYYLLTAAISPDSKTMAAVALTQENAEFVSRLVLFDLGVEEIHATYDLPGTAVTDLVFLDNNSLCAVGDDQTAVISRDGELLWKYDYGSSMLRTCSYDDDTCILAIADRTSGLSSQLVSIRPDREPLVVETEEMRGLHLNGNRLSILYTDTVEVRSRDLEALSQPVTVYDVRRIFTAADGRTLLVYSSEAGFVDLIAPFALS